MIKISFVDSKIFSYPSDIFYHVPKNLLLKGQQVGFFVYNFHIHKILKMNAKFRIPMSS